MERAKALTVLKEANRPLDVMADRTHPLKAIYTIVLIAFSIFAVTYVARWLFDPSEAGLSVEPPQAVPHGLLEYERNTIVVGQQASPAVVFVHNLQSQKNFWTQDVTEVQQGTGSGFLWDRRGHIVTNYHVVANADRVAVTLIDGRTFIAKKVGAELRKDLAVLKIELLDTNVQPFNEKVADSSRILVGQKAIAIGNPYGLDHTLTVGAVSAVGRSMSSVVEGVTIRDMIQTDAAVNPGNSGGPLLDSQGRLLGMNTLILRHSTGIGFAVPSNTIARIVNQIIEYGRPIQAGVGITIFDDRVSSMVARKVGVRGMLLKEVVPGTPADEAGLLGMRQGDMGEIILGDIILSVDGARITSYDDIYNAFDQKRPGDTVDIVYYRDGEEHAVTLDVINVSE